MSYNDCFGQDSPQLPEQGQQSRFLFQCPCVRGYAAGRQAPFITDADRMPVVVLAVRSDSLQRASAVNPAVARDVEMVTDILEPRWWIWSWRQVSKSRFRPSGVAEQWMMINVILRIPAG